MHMHSNKIDDLKKVNFPELMQKLGAEEAKPRTKAEIIALLKTEGDKFASFLEGLSESFLAERVTMPPGAQPATKSRFEMLLSPKEHEMHHRGQLMMLERMLGLVPHLTRQIQERMAQSPAGPTGTAVNPRFSPKALAFLRALKRNNDRDWFKARKDQYELLLRGPMIEIIERLAVDFRTFAPDLLASPKTSLFRIYRDTRFSEDKTPLKTHIAAVFPSRGLPKLGAPGCTSTWRRMASGPAAACTRRGRHNCRRFASTSRPTSGNFGRLSSRRRFGGASASSTRDRYSACRAVSPRTTRRRTT